MIKLSAPDGPFSMIISYKGFDIIFFGIPEGEEFQCDLKVFKGELDITKEFDVSGMIVPDSENLYSIMSKIDRNTKREKITGFFKFGKNSS